MTVGALAAKHPLGAFPTPIISDALDDAGVRGTLCRLRPRAAEPRTAVGRALTAQFYRLDSPPLDIRPGGGVGGPLEAVLRRMAKGDFVVIDLLGAEDAAAWGGLASMIALERGIAGAVINGACRDAAEIAGLGFPVWSVAVCPRRSRNEFGLAGLDRDLDIRGVRIRSGDLIVADDSGVVCVPADLAEKVVRRCAEILASETKVVAAVKARLQVDWNAV